MSLVLEATYKHINVLHTYACMHKGCLFVYNLKPHDWLSYIPCGQPQISRCGWVWFEVTHTHTHTHYWRDWRGRVGERNGCLLPYGTPGPTNSVRALCLSLSPPPPCMRTILPRVVYLTYHMAVCWEKNCKICKSLSGILILHTPLASVYRYTCTY